MPLTGNMKVIRSRENLSLKRSEEIDFFMKNGERRKQLRPRRASGEDEVGLQILLFLRLIVVDGYVELGNKKGLPGGPRGLACTQSLS